MRKTRLLAAATAFLCCLPTGFSLTGFANETDVPVQPPIAPPDSDWCPPMSFAEAMQFENTYGATYVHDNLICLVFREDIDSDVSYEVAATTDVASEFFHEVYEDEEAFFRYEVVTYTPFGNGTFNVSLNWNYNDIIREMASYDFYVDEGGNITETDLNAWVPDCKTEYNDFMERYGTVSIHDNYIAYCAKINYSTGATLTMEQTGTAEIKQILESYCNETEGMMPPPPGSTSYSVIVYQPVTDGTVDISWRVAREFDPESPADSEIGKSYEVSENGTHIKEILPAPDAFTQRISVVDYDTDEPISIDNDKAYQISFHTGYYVEYILMDGTYGMGINWGPTSEWDYSVQNPYVIDVSNFSLGFGAGKYEVVDIDLPEGYYLPEDYLNVVDYNNGSYDISIRLKKTLAGDVNGDGVFSVADAVLLQRWLLNVPDTKLANWEAADLYEDGELDVFDLVMMKRALVDQSPIPDGYIAVFHSDTEDTCYETYIYKIDNGAENHGFTYINVARSSFNMYHIEEITILGQGEVMWTDDVFKAAKENDAYAFVTIPGDDKYYTIEEFMGMFLMD